MSEHIGGGVSSAISRIDALAGGRMEAAVKHHHQRRLRKIGWDRALDPHLHGLPATGDPPVRDGNTIEVLIDGASAFPAMQEAMLQARSHVHLANWLISPDFRLERSTVREPSGSGPMLRDLLAELAVENDVRVLLWSGPPVPWAEVGRAGIRQIRDQLTIGTRVRCLLDSHERPLHTHHEKILIVDDEVAFVGGLDYTHIKGDRFDSPAHPLRDDMGWHDLAVKIRGPAVADVAAHFNLRWRAVSGESLAPGETAAVGTESAQVLATIPEKTYPSVPRGVFRILESYRRALSSAEHLIYVENQFLWSPEIVQILRSKLLTPPADDFRMVMILPAKATTGTDDTLGQLASLVQADRDHRLIASTIYSRAGSTSSPVYVHAKVAMVDDRWLTVGSANLNDHSLFNDTEVNVAIYDPRLARETRERLWSEHLEMPVDRVSGHPASVIDQVWVPTAQEQSDRLSAGAPLTHRLVKLPHLSRRSERLWGPLQGLFLDG
jgi:phosphatidylserine/phosphatidylglycerophosphate/cardiolipin synthase-like enzyme